MATLKARFAGLSSQQQGIICIVIAVFIFASQDAFTKILGQHYPVAQFLAIRFSAFFLFALLFVHYRCGIRTALRSNIPLLQILRAGLICAEIGLFAFAVSKMELSAQHALFSSFPLMATALSVPILGEKVGLRRWSAVIIGLLGVLIILRPGFGLLHPYAPLVLVVAFLFATYNVMSRYVSRYDRFETTFLYMALVCFLVYGIMAPFVWTPIQPQHYWMLALLCVTSALSHWLFTKAFELAEASVLQPFNYLILVFAILIGYVAFGEVLDPITALGASIVVGSGLYVWWREWVKKAEPVIEEGTH